MSPFCKKLIREQQACQKRCFSFQKKTIKSNNSISKQQHTEKCLHVYDPIAMHVLRGAPCRHTLLNSNDIVLQSHAWWDTRRHPCRLVPISASSSIARYEILFAARVFSCSVASTLHNTQFLLLALPFQPNSFLCCCRRRGTVTHFPAKAAEERRRRETNWPN